MKNEQLLSFLEFCKTSSKIAFQYKKRNKIVKVSFQKLYEDIICMQSFLNQKVEKSERVLLFSYPYSYLFYVFLFAGIVSGIQLVILDSYKNKNRFLDMIKKAHIKYALIDSYTRFLSSSLPKEIIKIRSTEYKKYDITNYSICDSFQIITYTSGTTGEAKPIIRSLDFLQEQISLIQRNINIEDIDSIYATLPMYTLLSVFLGNTTYIARNFQSYMKVDAVLTSIDSLLKIKRTLPQVKACFMGGAILYYKEAQKIKSQFPNANISYIYGASEGALIAKTTLDYYLKNPFSFQNFISGIKINLENVDQNQIGEIVIEGKTVLGSQDRHCTGDLGVVMGNALQIVGRKKYSNSKLSFYNYLADEEIRRMNPKIKKAFSFYYENKIYCVYEGKLTHRNPLISYKRFFRLPYDLKHKTKLDYTSVIKKIFHS